MSAQRPGAEPARTNEVRSFRTSVLGEGSWFQPEDGRGGRFRLDTVNQCLWKHVANGPDQRLLLAPKTFAVLKHLIDRADQLVTQEEFLEAVWPGVYVQPEVLKSQILSLRSLLEDDARQPGFIETSSRRGYRFIARISRDEGHISTLAPRTCRLIARERPLSELRTVLQRAVQQRQREVVFVTGESGIGKTSLADEFLHQTRLEMPQARLALGQCLERCGRKETYHPMLEALRELCMGQGGAQLQTELAACAPSWLAQIPALLQAAQRTALQRELLSATRDPMPRELIDFFERVSAERPVVLVFDDLQWSDHSTLFLIEMLARSRAPMQLVLIGIYRTGQHPVRGLHQELQLHGLCRDLPVEALTEDEIAAYLTTQVRGACALPAGLSSLVYRRTEGNPLFMVTLLEHLCQRRLLSKLEGAWHLEARLEAIEFEVPETLREMIDARMAQLSIDEQFVLEAASIMGVEFCPDWCAEALDLGPERTEELCQVLASRYGILRPAQSDMHSASGYAATRYQFSHAMYQQVLYRRQATSRRATLHLKLTQWLGSTSAPAAAMQWTPVRTHPPEHSGQSADTGRYRGRDKEHADLRAAQAATGRRAQISPERSGVTRIRATHSSHDADPGADSVLVARA